MMFPKPGAGSKKLKPGRRRAVKDRPAAALFPKPGKARKRPKSGFSDAVKEQILAEFGHRCILCGAWVPGGPENFHHTHRRGIGGDPTRITDSWWNCALLCLDCHSAVEASQALKELLRTWSARRREKGKPDGIVPSRREVAAIQREREHRD